MGDVRKKDERWIMYVDGEPAQTPGGRIFATQHENLAKGVSEDLEAYGADPLGPLSFVGLMASYLDFGSSVPPNELIKNILSCYNSTFDFALSELTNSVITCLPGSPILSRSTIASSHTGSMASLILSTLDWFQA